MSDDVLVHPADVNVTDSFKQRFFAGRLLQLYQLRAGEGVQCIQIALGQCRCKGKGAVWIIRQPEGCAIFPHGFFGAALGGHKVGDLFLIFQIPGCQLVLRCYAQEAVFHIVDAHAGQIFRVVPNINFLLHAHIYQFRGVKIQLQAVQLQGHAAPSDADGLAGAQQHQLQIVVTGGAAGHAVAQALVPDLYAALAFILGHTAAVVVAVHVAFYQGINSGNDFSIGGDMLPALQNGL